MLKYHNSYYKIWKVSFSARSIALHFGHKSLRKGIYSVHADTFLMTALKSLTLSYFW